MHPDARHGHGTDATFGQSGIERLVLRTMAIREDARLPEHEIVVSVFTPGGHAALPLQTLLRAGGLLQTRVGGYDLVALSAGPDSTLCGIFLPHLVGATEIGVRLAKQDDRFVDTTTGSEFRVDGLAISGPLEGRRLAPLPTMMNKWHSLTCFIPGIPIVEGEAPPAPVAEAQLAPVFDRLRAAGYRLDTTRRLYALEIPHEARCGFAVEIDGKPFHALLFSHESIAVDELLWRSHAAQAGAVLFVSTAKRYRDWTNTQTIPDREVGWSSLPDDPAFQHALGQAAEAVKTRASVPSPGLSQFLSALSDAGFDCKIDRSCYRDTLPVRAIAGVCVEIAGDPFIVYRFSSDADARHAHAGSRHGLTVGCFVLRSDPEDIYKDRARVTRRRPDGDITWSRLLASEAFVEAARAAAGPPK
jgi:hypothetical protein